MKVSVEKPGSPEEVLEHYGKKGMKWGQRNTPTSSSGSGHFRSRAVAKAAGREAAGRAQKEALQRGASGRSAARAGARAASPAAKAAYRAQRGPSTASSFKQQFPTSKSRTAEIHRARVQEQAMRVKAIAETNPAKREKLIKQWRDSPDRAVALRMTRGEKVVLGVLTGVLAVPTAGAAPAALAGYGGTTVAIRKGVERGQRKRARVVEQ